MCSDINLPGKSEFPPLHSAIFVGNLEGAQLLIEAGADVNLLNDDGYGSYTPLHQVIISLNQVEQIELRDNFIVTLLLRELIQILQITIICQHWIGQNLTLIKVILSDF